MNFYDIKPDEPIVDPEDQPGFYNVYDDDEFIPVQDEIHSDLLNKEQPEPKLKKIDEDVIKKEPMKPTNPIDGEEVL